MRNNEELHCRLGYRSYCIQQINIFFLQYYVRSICLLQSISSFHLIHHANKWASCRVKHIRYFDNSPRARYNLSSSSSSPSPGTCARTAPRCARQHPPSHTARGFSHSCSLGRAAQGVDVAPHLSQLAAVVQCAADPLHSHWRRRLIRLLSIRTFSSSFWCIWIVCCGLWLCAQSLAGPPTGSRCASRPPPRSVPFLSTRNKIGEKNTQLNSSLFGSSPHYVGS